jgi:hypothetical protein
VDGTFFKVLIMATNKLTPPYPPNPPYYSFFSFSKKEIIIIIREEGYRWLMWRVWWT